MSYFGFARPGRYRRSAFVYPGHGALWTGHHAAEQRLLALAASATPTSMLSRVTGKGDAYASALTRLANQNLAEVEAGAIGLSFCCTRTPRWGRGIEMAVNLPAH